MSEANWAIAAPAASVVEGAPSRVYAHGEEIALYRIGGEVFATSDVCTHGFARLSGGHLDGWLIACPLHQGVFDVRTGRCAGGPVDADLASFDVRVRDSMVEVRPRAAAGVRPA